MKYHFSIELTCEISHSDLVTKEQIQKSLSVELIKSFEDRNFITDGIGCFKLNRINGVEVKLVGGTDGKRVEEDKQ